MFRYITTPIYYVNDEPHLGHLYTSIIADILTRSSKIRAQNPILVTGTDEHGGKIAQSALLHQKAPQEYVDGISEKFKKMANEAMILYDIFIRTSQKQHHEAVTHLWKVLESKNMIYLGNYEGWYAIRDEAFYDESEIFTTENGEKLAPSGAPVTWMQESCYFFRLSLWRKPLLDFYQKNPQAILPSTRYREVLGLLRDELKDLAISRSRMDWGIPVPSKDSPPHVVYVWLDALTNYLSALGYPKTETLQEFWPHSLHLIGKDILRFHAIYWPAFLMAAELPPPQRIFAHGWWTHNGQKMSKSLGNGINPFQLLKTYGVDRVRYFLARAMQLGSDGDFSDEKCIQICNQELSNDFSNLAFRTLSFIQRHMASTLERYPLESHTTSYIEREKLFEKIGSLECMESDNASQEEEKIQHWKEAFPDVRSWFFHQKENLENALDEQNLALYLQICLQGVHLGNLTINALAPWKILKDIRRIQEAPLQHKLKRHLHRGLETLLILLRDLCIVYWPILPNACENLWSQLYGKSQISKFPLDNQWSQLGKELTQLPDLELPNPTVLFYRLEQTSL